MKQNTPFTQRRHAHILNLILNRSLSLVLSLALSLSACHPDSLDDLDGDNDSGIALTHFLAEILTPTDGITTIPTAARTRSRASLTAASGRPTISNIGMPSTQYASTVTG